MIGRRHLVAAGVGLALLLPACSLLLSDSPTQCRDNSGCARFPSTVCDRVVGVCVAGPRPDAAVGGGTGTGGQGAPDGGSRDGGPAGGGGPGGTGASRCPDLDGDAIPDCQESLVPNADFATGISGWKPEVGVYASFSTSADAEGNPQSGSLVVNNTAQADPTSGLTMKGVSMCLSNTTATAYQLYLEVNPAASADGFAQAGVAVAFFPSTDCSGPQGGMAPSTLLDGSAGGWRVLQQIVQPVGGTNSLLVRLVIGKLTATAVQGSFDNLLIRPR